MMKFLSLCLICVAAIMVDAQCYRGEGTVEEVSVKTSGQCNDDIGEDTYSLSSIKLSSLSTCLNKLRF